MMLGTIGSTKRVVIYTRVSTDEQVNNNSLPVQEADCRRYVEGFGWMIVTVILDDHTGTKLDRPGLKNFLKIVDTNDRPLPGKIEIAVDGRKWTFAPDTAWSAQDYKVTVDSQLEDVSGNTPVHPFDGYPIDLARIRRPTVVPGTVIAATGSR